MLRSTEQQSIQGNPRTEMLCVPLERDTDACSTHAGCNSHDCDKVSAID